MCTTKSEIYEKCRHITGKSEKEECQSVKDGRECTGATTVEGKEVSGRCEECKEARRKREEEREERVVQGYFLPNWAVCLSGMVTGELEDRGN